MVSDAGLPMTLVTAPPLGKVSIRFGFTCCATPVFVRFRLMPPTPSKFEKSTVSPVEPAGSVRVTFPKLLAEPPTK